MDSLIQFLIGGLIQGCVFAMLALGFSLVFRVTGVINLAQGAFCVLGPMAMQILEAAFHAPVWLAAPGGLVVSTALAVGIGSVSFVPAVSRLSTSSSLILTAGLLTFLDGLIFVIWGNEPYALPGFSGTPPFIVGAIRIPSQSVWLLGTCGILLVSIWYLLQRTGLGRALRACAENPMAARLMGIDVRRMTLVSFGMAAFVGCLTGIMVAPITALQFDTGDFFTMSGFIAVAIGGIGNLAGSVIGGVFLGLTQQLAAGYISTLFANTLALALLIVVLLVRPAGLFAVGTRRRTDVREAQAVHRPLVRFDGPVSVGIGGVLFAVMAVLPLVPLPDGMIDSLLITLTLFIAVLGLDVLMGFAGQVSLGQSGFMALGGYAASILSVSYDWPPVASMGAALAISCAIGASLAIVTTRIRGLYLALATLAFALLVDSLLVGLVDLTGGPSGLVGIPSLAIGSFAFDTSDRMYYLVLGTCALLVVGLLGGLRSSFGRGLMAVRADQAAAAALGMKVGRIKVAAATISAGLGSIAGSFYAFQLHFLSPDMVATSRSFELISMLVLGGEATLFGGLLGAALLTLLPIVFAPLAAYKLLMQGLLLVATFLYLPEGMFGKLVGWLEQALNRPAAGLVVRRSART